MRYIGPLKTLTTAKQPPKILFTIYLNVELSKFVGSLVTWHQFFKRKPFTPYLEEKAIYTLSRTEIQISK